MGNCTNCKRTLPVGAVVCTTCGRAVESSAERNVLGKGRISFARLSSLSAKALKTTIIIDGKEIGKLKEQQKLSKELPYGVHSVRLRIPLGPSYKTEVVIDKDHRDIRCAFRIDNRSGRPEPVRIRETPPKGIVYLQPDVQTKDAKKRREAIKAAVLGLLFFAIMSWAVWSSKGETMNMWVFLLLAVILVIVIGLLLSLRKKRNAGLQSAPVESPDETMTEAKQKEAGSTDKEQGKCMETMELPIYEIIQKNLRGGELPQGFSIEGADSRKSPVKFAPGAMDGMLLYHMTPYKADEETRQQILEALKLISEENNGEKVPQIMDIFEKLESKTAMVRLYDTIVDVMLFHIQSLNVEKILKFGDYLICYGISFLSVKLGLTLLSIFTDKVSFVKEVHLMLGAYDEFTWFAARYLSSGTCEDGNAALFELAQHVHGWGRIHAVNYLQPETKEIRDWLLFEGADNTIVPQYSAYLCLLKAAAAERLEAGASQKEFTAVGSLLESALEEGPCPGILDAERMLSAYLHAAKQFPLNRELVQRIRDWSKESGLNPKIAELADQLL